MAEHKPATWAWTSAPPGAPTALVGGDGIVLTALSGIKREDARIIAAAPEMLTLLRELAAVGDAFHLDRAILMVQDIQRRTRDLLARLPKEGA